MNRSYEEDKTQCTAIGQNKKRCARIATHSCGGNAYCERHNQMAIRDRANSVPLKASKPSS
jgi:hypothetical protein